MALYYNCDMTLSEVFGQCEHSFYWQLRCHWQKGYQVAVEIHGRAGSQSWKARRQPKNLWQLYDAEIQTVLFNFLLSKVILPI